MTQWAIRLAPLLIGEAQAAHRGVDDTVAQDYVQVKAAILDRLGLNEEVYRRVLLPRALSHQGPAPCGGPKVKGRLRVVAKTRIPNWAPNSGIQVLEQFVQILLPGR